MASQTDSTHKLIIRYETEKDFERPKRNGIRGRAHDFFDRQNVNNAKEYKKQVFGIRDPKFSSESTALMRSNGYLASDYTSGDEIPAMFAHASGISAEMYRNQVDDFVKKHGDKLPNGMGDSLYNSADILGSLQAGDLYLTDSLWVLNENPQNVRFNFSPYDQGIKTGGKQLAFGYSAGDGFRGALNLTNPLTGKAKAVVEKRIKEKSKKLIGKGAQKLAKKAGLKASKRTIETTVTGLASELGPLAPLIGKAAGWLYEKTISKLSTLIKKNGKKLLALGAMIAGGGLLVSSPLLIAGGLGLMSMGSLGAGIIGLTAGLNTIGAAVGSILLIGIGSFLVTFFVALIVSIILIAFIIFIITTGAYVVPGGVGSFTPEVYSSEFLDVNKIAEESDTGSRGPFSNDDLPLTINYTVTITAKEEIVSNITISDTCTILQESGSSPCPTASPPITNPPIDTVLNPGESYEFTYIRVFNSQHEDAWVGDTIRISFDTPEDPGEEAFGNAIIKIGDPPDFCPSGWPLNTVQSSYYVTQGAYGPYSHSNGSNGWASEALDISAADIYQKDVIATHRGQVQVFDRGNQGYGKHVRVVSICEGREFFSLYAHLDSVIVQPGRIIEKGTKIGEVGSTGFSQGPHLHYEFRYLLQNGVDVPAGGISSTWIDNPPYMMTARPPSTLVAPFYLPKDVPRECVTRSGCNTDIP